MSIKNTKGTKEPAEVKMTRRPIWASPELADRVQAFAKLNKYQTAAEVVAAGLELLNKQKGTVAV